jgi:hypothetical protein
MVSFSFVENGGTIDVLYAEFAKASIAYAHLVRKVVSHRK